MTLEQIREAARELVQDRQWDDAWNGAYPLKPTEAEVEAAYEELLALARDVIANGMTDENCSPIERYCLVERLRLRS